MDHQSYQLADIIPEIEDILTAGGDILLMGGNVKAAVSCHEEMYDIDISCADYDDDELFYHFYLGHRIDCLEEYSTSDGNVVLSYPNLNSDQAKLLLSAGFAEFADQLEYCDKNCYDSVENFFDEN